MAADFTPNLNPYSGQGSFRFWVQKVLPLVYDDSLSYYELLCKVVTFLNNVIQDMDTAEENIELIRDAYNELQNYVNTYFDNLDIEAELDSIINRMVRDGRFENQVFEALKNNPALLETPVHFELPGAVETQLPGVVADQISGAVSPLIPDAVSDWLDENVRPTTPVVDESLTISGAAADAKVVGDKLTEIDDTMFAHLDLNGDELTWKYSTLINPSNGQPVTNNSQHTFATTSYIALHEGTTGIRYTGATTDQNGVPYTAIAYFYTDSGWTGDRIVISNRNTISVPTTATRIRVSFGRATASNIDCTVSDTDTFALREYYRNYDVDATLTVSGAAADAKVTGDWAFTALTLKAGNSTRIPGNADLNDYKTIGNYHVLTATDAGNIANIPQYQQGRLFVLGTLGGNYLTQIFVPVNTNKYSYFIRQTTTGNFSNSIWSCVPAESYAVRGISDYADYITRKLNNSGKCYLQAGTYYVSGIDMPENTQIIGCGYQTKIVLLDSVTTGYAIKMNNNCVISNVRITGNDNDLSFVEGDIESIHLGNRHGILYLGTANESSGANTVTKGIISDCYIDGFTGGAITCEQTGPGTRGLNVNNVQIVNCGAGINITRYSEYNRFTNINAHHCYYGCINNGGNNIISDCNFSEDVVGVYMNGSSGKCLLWNGESATARNGAHGIMSNCTINHSGHFTPNRNHGWAIYYRYYQAGFVFSNLCVFYGKTWFSGAACIVIDNSVFDGVDMEIANDGNSLLFNGCNIRDSKAYIKHTVSDTNYVVPSDFDETGNLNKTKFVNCYDKAMTNVTAYTLCDAAGIFD